MKELHYISLPENIALGDATFGKKTLRLAQLVREHLPVPPFVGISSTSLCALLDDARPTSILGDAVKEIRKTLKTPLYAVRSSSLSEDSDDSAHAGEFHTVLAVLPHNLETAILEVLDDATKKQVPFSKFSLLIQEYITPTHTGVLFTRNPLGGMGSILEWHAGTTTDVVLGKKSEQAEIFRTSIHLRHIPVPHVQQLFSHALHIEALYAHPQDIEWVCSNSKMYIVQTRPITTISNQHHVRFLKIEKSLSGLKDFFFERSEIAASYPSPTRLTFDILRHITAKNGPIDSVYTNFGISRNASDHLTLIENQLFINKEAELREYFPALSFFSKRDGTPAVSSLFGLVRTYKNTGAITNLPATSEKSAELAVALKQALQKVESTEKAPSSATALSDFTAHYPLIFTINLLSLTSFKRTEQLLPKGSPTLIQFSSYKLHSIGSQTYGLLPPTGDIVGNSLDIADESPFKAFHTPHTTEGGDIAAWCERQNPEVITALEKVLQEFRNFEQLREAARWLTVLLIHRIRISLQENVAQLGLTWSPIFYECTLEEFGKSEYDEGVLRTRSEERIRNCTSPLPSTLASFPTVKSTERFSVSEGKSSGLLVNETTFPVPKSTPVQKPILLVASLNPSLVSYFPHIAGIISLEGNLLAHLAIMAREAHIPVLVWPNADTEFTLGRNILLDATTIKITPLQ